MTDKEKFEYEMMAVTDLVYLAQRCAKHEDDFKAELKHKSRKDKDYLKIVDARNKNKRRWNYLKERIEARQMKMF